MITDQVGNRIKVYENKQFVLGCMTDSNNGREGLKNKEGGATGWHSRKTSKESKNE